MAGLALAFKLPPNIPQPLPHILQPVAPARPLDWRAAVKTGTVVLDNNLKPVFVQAHLDAYMLSAGVLERVVQGFLHGEEGLMSHLR